MRLLGEDRVAGQVHLERLGLAHQPRQPLRAAEAGDDPEVDLRLAERRRLGREPEVARHRQLTAAAEGDAVDRRDRGRARRLHLAQHRVAAVQQARAGGGVHLRELLDVGAGGEREDVRGRDHHRADLGARVAVLPQLAELGDHLRAERVGRRPVEPHDRDLAARLQQHGLLLVEVARRAAGRGRSPGRSSCRAGPARRGGAGSAAARSGRPTRPRRARAPPASRRARARRRARRARAGCRRRSSSRSRSHAGWRRPPRARGMPRRTPSA